MLMKNYTKLIDYILSNINEIDIFSYYLGVPVDTIQECIEHNSKISNPLRNDTNPSLGFKYVFTSKGGIKLRARDFANDYYSGDFIDIAGITLRQRMNTSHGYTPNSKHGFIAIIKDIIDNLIEVDNRPLVKQLPKPITTFKEIRTDVRKWVHVDYNYWLQFKVPMDYIKQYVFPILTVHIENQLVYYYTLKDPCYRYRDTIIKDKTITKVYYPLRSKRDTRGRFITNNSIIPFDAIVHLRYTGNLVIIKAYKDYILLQYILQELDINDVDVVPITSENDIITDKYAEFLKSKYDNIFTIFDFDNAGIRLSNKYRHKYDFKPLFFTNGRFKTLQFSGKDLAEVLTNSEYDDVLAIIQAVYDNYKY